MPLPVERAPSGTESLAGEEAAGFRNAGHIGTYRDRQPKQE